MFDTNKVFLSLSGDLRISLDCDKHPWHPPLLEYVSQTEVRCWRGAPLATTHDDTSFINQVLSGSSTPSPALRTAKPTDCWRGPPAPSITWSATSSAPAEILKIMFGVPKISRCIGQTINPTTGIADGPIFLVIWDVFRPILAPNSIFLQISHATSQNDGKWRWFQIALSRRLGHFRPIFLILGPLRPLLILNVIHYNHHHNHH